MSNNKIMSEIEWYKTAYEIYESLAEEIQQEVEYSEDARGSMLSIMDLFRKYTKIADERLGLKEQVNYETQT